MWRAREVSLKEFKGCKGKDIGMGRSHTCNDQLVGIEDARRKKKVAKREGVQDQ